MAEPRLTLSQFNEIFEQFKPQIVELRSKLTELSLSGQTALGNLEFISQRIRSFGLESRNFNDAGIAVDLAGERPETDIVALRVLVKGFSSRKGLNSERYVRNAKEWNAFDSILETAIGLGIVGMLNNFGLNSIRNIRVIFEMESKAHYDNARFLIEKGVLRNVTKILAMNCNPAIPAGRIGVKFGAVFPSSEKFTLRIYRECGDSTRFGNHVIQVAAHAITSLTQITTRKTDPLRPVKIAITSVHSSDSNNDEPDSVMIKGDIYIVDESASKQVLSLIDRTLQAVTGASEVKYQFESLKHSPVLSQDDSYLNRMRSAAESVLGKNKVVTLEYLNKTCEGFARYLKVIPGVILHLGSRIDDSDHAVANAIKLDIVDQNIQTGVKTLSWLFLN